jgi:hypothetical protein
LWERYKKEIEYDINNVFDFCNFLTQEGFKYYLNQEKLFNNIIEKFDNVNKENDNKIMNFLFSLLEFSILLIHKNDLFDYIDLKNENNFIFVHIKCQSSIYIPNITEIYPRRYIKI